MLEHAWTIRSKMVLDAERNFLRYEEKQAFHRLLHMFERLEILQKLAYPTIAS